MKPTEAEPYHSLGDGGGGWGGEAGEGGGAGEGDGWKLLYSYESMDTWHRCSPTQANKGQSKEMQMRSLHGGRCDIGLAFVYKPIYCRGGEGRGWRVGGVGEGNRSIFFVLHVERGAASATPWLLGFQNTPRTYLPTLIQQSLKEEELEVFEPSEVKHSERLRCCVEIDYWKEEEGERKKRRSQHRISAFIHTSHQRLSKKHI